jgi:hypothetical protein
MTKKVKEMEEVLLLLVACVHDIKTLLAEHNLGSKETYDHHKTYMNRIAHAANKASGYVSRTKHKKQPTHTIKKPEAFK